MDGGRVCGEGGGVMEGGWGWVGIAEVGRDWVRLGADRARPRRLQLPFARHAQTNTIQIGNAVSYWLIFGSFVS